MLVLEGPDPAGVEDTGHAALPGGVTPHPQIRVPAVRQGCDDLVEPVGAVEQVGVRVPNERCVLDPHAVAFENDSELFDCGSEDRYGAVDRSDTGSLFRVGDDGGIPAGRRDRFPTGLVVVSEPEPLGDTREDHAHTVAPQRPSHRLSRA